MVLSRLINNVFLAKIIQCTIVLVGSVYVGRGLSRQMMDLASLAHQKWPILMENANAYITFSKFNRMCAKDA